MIPTVLRAARWELACCHPGLHATNHGEECGAFFRRTKFVTPRPFVPQGHSPRKRAEITFSCRPRCMNRVLLSPSCVQRMAYGGVRLDDSAHDDTNHQNHEVRAEPAANDDAALPTRDFGFAPDEVADHAHERDQQ